VVIDAMNGDREALARESADLIYNLTVIWAASGLRPQDVWAEMDRRERMLGIAEKLPKSRVRAKPASAKPVTAAAKPAAAMAVRRPVIALDSRRPPKRR
jgi:phosphoribosyl-ATP pyrophosphohydrolase